MKTEEINKYLIKYDNFIQKEVSKRVKPQHFHVLQFEDIVQETRILLFKLIQERFDPSIATIDVFITTHTPYSVYKAVTYITRNMYYTGKYEDGEGRKEPRPESKKIDDLALHVDFIDFEPSRYPTDSSKSLSFPVHYVLISGTYIPFDVLDKTYHEAVKAAYAQIDSERVLIEGMDAETIKRKVRERLDADQRKIFDLLVMKGENPSFTKGARGETKYLAATEIAERLGYPGAWAVTKQIKIIREITLQVLKELDISFLLP
jgi:hypothetical protein